MAKELGPKLYQSGELPHHRSPVVCEYYKKLGREEDVQVPLEININDTDPSIGSDTHPNYSYQWALRQPLPVNADKVISAMIRTKAAKYLDSEISRVIRELGTASETKKKKYW